MIRWHPDTCYCIVECPSPSKNGKFLKKCRTHANSRNTTDVYQHNIANQERQELDDKIRDNKKRITKEATRP